MWLLAGEYIHTKAFVNAKLLLTPLVYSTNGWFEDGIAGKPWVNESPTAKLDFWNARDQWYPTWEQGMEVRSVKMWQQKGFNGC